MEARWVVVDDEGLNEKYFQTLDDALEYLKEQGGGEIGKLNTVIVAFDSYDHLFGDDVSALDAIRNRIGLEGTTNNGSGRCIFSIGDVSSETIADYLRENGDWGDLDEYINELADRAGIDPADYMDEKEMSFDDCAFCTAIQNALGVDLGY